MYAHVEKPKEHKSKAVANAVSLKSISEKQGFGFVDNRPEAIALKSHSNIEDKRPEVRQFSQNPKMLNKCLKTEGVQKNEVRKHISATIQMMPYAELKTGKFYMVNRGDNRIVSLFLRTKKKINGFEAFFYSDRSDKTKPIIIKNEDQIIKPSNIDHGKKLQEVAIYHLGKVKKPWGDFMNETGMMLRGIPGGSAFTNKRNKLGNIRTEREKEDDDIYQPLNSTEIDDLMKKTKLFYEFTKGLSKNVAKSGPLLRFPIYRAMRISESKSLSKGGKLSDIIPSSCSFSQKFGLDWGKGTGKVLLKITVPIDYQMLMMSYPMGKPTMNDPVARNQRQMEVIIGPSEYTIDSMQYIKNVLVLHVTPRLLTVEESLTPMIKAKEKQKLKEKDSSNKKKSFVIGAKIFFTIDGIGAKKLSSYFSDTKIEEIKKLKNGESVKDMEGGSWKISEAFDNMFDSCTMEYMGK